MEENEIKRYILPKEVEFSAECQFNTDVLRELFGVGPTINSKGYDVTYRYYVQKRKHKKKRINKKWLKRYGMQEKFITLKDCEVTRSNNSDEVEFTFKGVGSY